jgi:thioredoxin reductase
MSRRLLIVGAGPIGIAAAIAALERGLEVTVLEKGGVGEALRQWGRTRFFTPLSMNITPSMRALLGSTAPAGDALLTGLEMVENVLQPVAESSMLRDRIRLAHRVTAIGRRGLTREDHAGHPLRAERPFRVQFESAQGEGHLEADVIFDASGGYALPRAIGTGGLPATGERDVSDRLIRSLGALESSLASLRGKRVLLLGHGHSAANAVDLLANLAHEWPGTQVIWAVRTGSRRPCEEVAGDPLPERERVVSRANDLAAAPPAFLSVERRTAIDSITKGEGSIVCVTLTGGRHLEVDAVAAFTGYKPDGSFLTELPLEISPVTEGGARLYRAISNLTDCLSVPKLRSEDLESGEPDFYFIGSRGYGRARTFLLQAGLSQLETILDRVAPRSMRMAAVGEVAGTAGDTDCPGLGHAGRL